MLHSSAVSMRILCIVDVVVVVTYSLRTAACVQNNIHDAASSTTYMLAVPNIINQ